ncbi:MAG: HIT family protein [Cellulosilyticaceae bacterium]
MNETCIFCEIISGNIPSFTIYEDEKFKVILDRFPAAAGHMLVISKMHYNDIFELPGEVANELMIVVKKMADLLKNNMKVESLNLVQNNGEVAGQTINHFHMHLIPRTKDDGVVLNKTTHTETTIEELEKISNQLLGK